MRDRPREAPSLAQRLVVALLATFVVVVVETRLGDSDALRSLELETLDWRFRLRGPLRPGDDVALVMVDDAAVARAGAWPPSRELIAAAVDRLAEAGARVIVLNLLFAEARAPLPAEARELLEAAAGSLPPAATPLRRRIEAALHGGGEDAALAAAIGAAGRVVTPYAFVFDPRQGNVAGVPGWARRTAYRVRTASGSGASPPVTPVGLLVPAPGLAAVAASTGHVTLLLEPDGSLRADLPVVTHDDDAFPSLAVEAARLFLGVGRDRMAVDGGRGVVVGELFLPTDEVGRQLVNYYGPEGTVPTHSLVDLLDGAIERGALAGRVVVLGASAAGAGDRFVTPFAARLPGSEFLATAVDNMLGGRSLVRNAATRALDVLAIAAMALAAALLAGRRSPVASLLALLLLMALWAVAAQAAFVAANVWLAGLAPSAAAISAGLGVEGLRLAAERRRRRWLERQRANLARYFAPAVVERLAASGAPIKLDRTQDAVVMFVDLVGFTRLAEAMRPAEAIDLLRGFHTRVEAAVFGRMGMVNQFVGDGVMACFGVPERSPTAAADAVRAALDLLAALDPPAAGDDPPPAPPRLKVGIGLHHGPVLMGDVGGARQLQFTLIGDTVNVASRLEALTRQEDTQLIVSDALLEAARPHLERSTLVRLQPLPELKLRGRDGIVRVWRLVPPGPGVAATVRTA
ncbi:MAG TPA: adenylate/guanylate cyclase domain-containing protein [Geminicoccaceae bacterium]|nr:adenylate/guanylate cyclase domain-containing protein [Geminicoccaceae bacterium]